MPTENPTQQPTQQPTQDPTEDRAGEPPLGEEERRRRAEALEELVGVVRPVVQADGGDLVVLGADVERGVVEVQLRGACSSCAMTGATLTEGVGRFLRERLDWVTEVVGSVDDQLDFETSLSLGRGNHRPRRWGRR